MTDLQAQAKEAADNFIEFWNFVESDAEMPNAYRRVIGLVRRIECGELVESAHCIVLPEDLRIGATVFVPVGKKGYEMRVDSIEAVVRAHGGDVSCDFVSTAIGSVIFFSRVEAKAALPERGEE